MIESTSADVLRRRARELAPLRLSERRGVVRTSDLLFSAADELDRLRALLECAPTATRRRATRTQEEVERERAQFDDYGE